VIQGDSDKARVHRGPRTRVTSSRARDRQPRARQDARCSGRRSGAQPGDRGPTSSGLSSCSKPASRSRRGMKAITRMAGTEARLLVVSRGWASGTRRERPGREADKRTRRVLWKAMAAFHNGVLFLKTENYELAIMCFEKVTEAFPRGSLRSLGQPGVRPTHELLRQVEQGRPSKSQGIGSESSSAASTRGSMSRWRAGKG